MNIIVHYSEKPEDMRDLAKKAASVYTGAVLERIRGLPWSGERKLDLLDEVTQCQKADCI